MEVRIGIRENGRDLSFESSLSAKELSQQISDAIAKSSPLVELADDKGKTILIPTASIAYVEIGADQSRRVGFIA
jgi:hypothetical protein